MCFFILYKFVQKYFPFEDQLSTVMNVHRSGRMIITLEFSRWIFETSSTRVNENQSSGKRDVPCRGRDTKTDRRKNGQTDRHYEVNISFFFANASINNSGTVERG